MNLEKEVLALAEAIHFCDKQTGVYSIKMADLILRCSVEIESISKDLYEQYDGNMYPVDQSGNLRDLYFDTDCLDLLEQKWILSKKEVYISAPTFYFTKYEYKILTPLRRANKRGASGADWKQAYQSIKHNRVKNLSKANLKHLIRVLAALFILNIYYRDTAVDLGRVYMSQNDFDARAESSIFSASYVKATALKMSCEMSDESISWLRNENRDNAIFIIKYTDESFSKMHIDYCHDSQITLSKFNNSKRVKEYLLENPGSVGKSINEICMEIGGADFLAQIVSFSKATNNKSTKKQVVINKNQTIYPNCMYEEDSPDA